MNRRTGELFMADLLIVEDDNAIHQLLIDILSTETTYRLTSAYSGTEALLYIQNQPFDLILLDLMLPGMSGEEILEEVGDIHQGGIIVLSAKSELEDKVGLLQIGADDYMTKPFHKEELLARIESVLRRYKIPTSSKKRDFLTYQDITLHRDEYQAFFKENKLSLTTTEFKILQTLIEFPDKVFTRESIYQLIWNSNSFIEDNAINVHVSNIRRKIAEFDDTKPYIETIWGIGFKMT